MKEELIGVIMQAFYGNRTHTELREELIDSMLQGNLGDDMSLEYEPDRTIVRIPNSECVLVYNKYQEAAQLETNKKWALKDGYIAKPLAFIPEQGIEIYSRCFVCRMDLSGNFESVQPGDEDVIFKYLAQ